MAPATVAALLDQVLEAPAHVHAAGMVHRDVKPAELLRGGVVPAPHHDLYAAGQVAATLLTGHEPEDIDAGPVGDGPVHEVVRALTSPDVARRPDDTDLDRAAHGTGGGHAPDRPDRCAAARLDVDPRAGPSDTAAAPAAGCSRRPGSSWPRPSRCP